MRRTKAIVAVAVVIALSVVMAACGTKKNNTTSNSSAPAKTSYKKGGTVTIVNVQGQTWPCQFNPFNPANNAVSLGFVYEPLKAATHYHADYVTPAWSATLPRIRQIGRHIFYQ